MKNRELSGADYYIIVMILALFYFFVAKISLLLYGDVNVAQMGASLSEGILLAFGLYFGKRVWVSFFIGSFALAYSSNIDLIPSFGLAVISSIEMIIAVSICNRYELNVKFQSFRDFMGFVLLIAFVLQPFNALFSNIILLLSFQIEGGEFFPLLFSWYVNGITGQILFASFILLFIANFKKIDFINFLIYGLVFFIYLYLLEIILNIHDPLAVLLIALPVIIYININKGLEYGSFFTLLASVVLLYSDYLNFGESDSISYFNSIIDYNLSVMIFVLVSFSVGILIKREESIKTEFQKRVDEEMRKNQEHQHMMINQSRLAQMGEMIAMIAHQWRQPLNNLSLANQLLISKYKKGKLDDEAVEYFKVNSKKQIDLMSSTIDDFRTFFKSEKIKYRFSVNSVIENILDMVKSIYTTSGVDIEFKTQKEYFSFGYPNDLGQAVLNIISNAKDALIECHRQNKKIVIKLEKKNSWILLSICDNAGGIPEEIKDRIFEPYFSTKDEKSGTGLGLYMTKIIVEEKLEAKIDVKNRDGGACFEIYLIEDEVVAK